MTTIAVSGRTIACDGYITSGDTILQTDCNKIFKLNDGSLIGFAGNTHNWAEVVEFFNSVSPEKKWPKINGNSAIIRLMKNGQVFTYDEDGRPWERPNPNAIGSGRAFALAAMDCGKTAPDAIKIAIDRDVFSGGTIRVLHLNDLSTSAT